MPPNVNPPSNSEIEEALREFEMKSQMEEQKYKSNQKIDKKPSNTPIINFIIKYSRGAIKDQIHAEYVMILFFVLCIFLSLFLVFRSRDHRPSVTPRDLLVTPPPPKEVMQR